MSRSIHKSEGYISSEMVLSAVLLLVICIYSAATYARNALFTEKLSLWQDTIAKSPRKARPYCYAGDAYLSRKQMDKAIEMYTSALRIDNEILQAHYNLNIAYNAVRNLPKAAEHYKEVIRISPDYYQAHFNLGLIYLDMGQLEAARYEFETTLIINPGSTQARDFIEYLHSISTRTLTRMEKQNQS